MLARSLTRSSLTLYKLRNLLLLPWSHRTFSGQGLPEHQRLPPSVSCCLLPLPLPGSNLRHPSQQHHHHPIYLQTSPSSYTNPITLGQIIMSPMWPARPPYPRPASECLSHHHTISQKTSLNTTLKKHNYKSERRVHAVDTGRHQPVDTAAPQHT
jgi:hypothetical protein